MTLKDSFYLRISTLLITGLTLTAGLSAADEPAVKSESTPCMDESYSSALDQRLHARIAATLADGMEIEPWQRLRQDLSILEARCRSLGDQRGAVFARLRSHQMDNLEPLATHKEDFRAYADKWQRSLSRAASPSASPTTKITLGTLSGRVTRTLDGQPLSDVSVFAENHSTIAYTTTDADGRFSIDVPAGEYAVVTSSPTYRNEAFDDIPCVEFCSYLLGDPIPVAEGEEVSGIDFALDRNALLSGRITDAQTGQPLELVDIWARETADVFNWPGLTSSGADGSFEMSLPPGTYYLYAEVGGYQSEVFDDVKCDLRFNSADCPAEEMQELTVGLNESITGLDFSLTPLGSISGRVTDADTGQGIPSSFVEFEPVDNANSRGIALTDDDGFYQSPALQPGSYYVHTAHIDFYVDELYDDIPCAETAHTTDCDLPSGDEVVVLLNQETTNIDFALEIGGSIVGTVTDSQDGSPIPGADVTVYNLDGFPAAFALTDTSGRFEAKGLGTGQYQVKVSTGRHVSEVYDDIPCTSMEGCPVEQGDLVSVQRSQTTAGIDFSLDRLGTMAGRAVDETGQPIQGLYVEVFLDPYFGNSVSQDFTDEQGNFFINRLQPGSYVLLAGGHSGRHIPELYEDLPCPRYSCDFAAGTRLEIEPNTALEGIDVQLQEGGSISGTVKDSISGLPYVDSYVEVYNSQGLAVADGYTDSEGAFLIEGLGAGQHYAIASVPYGGARQIYGGDDCFDVVDICDPTTGSSISVLLAQETTGVGFELPVAGCFDDMLCLGAGSRFRVITQWRNNAGEEGYGHVQYLSQDSGYFWFFDSNNIEGVVKVLDACGLADRFWVFAAGLTDVQVTFWVTDRTTGETNTYVNPQGQAFEPIQDTDAFSGCGAASTSGPPTMAQTPPEIASSKACDVMSGRMCLNGGRFAVEAFYQSVDAPEQIAFAVPLTDDSGYFWFFDAQNVEILIKVLDACTLADRFWVFGAGLTDVQVRLRVTDTETGEVREYHNPQGNAFVPIQDTQAFASCL